MLYYLVLGIDVLVALNKGSTEWLTKLMLPGDSSSFVPFTDKSEFTLAIKMLDIVTRQEGLNILSIARVNIVCLSDLEYCLEAVSGVRSKLNRVIILCSLYELELANLDKLTVLLRRVNINRMVVYYDKFIDVYNCKSILKKLAPTINMSLVSYIDSIREDIGLIISLSRMTPNINYGIVLEPEKLLTLMRDFNIKFLYRVKWLLYDIVPAHTQLDNTPPIFMLVRNSESKVLALLKSGLKILGANGFDSINVDDIKEYIINDGYNYETTITSITPCIGFKINNVLLTEDDIMLLKYIDEYKCLRSVAKIMNASYTSIKKRITELEKLLGIKLVISRRGGTEGGLTELTPIGKDILSTVLPLINDLRKVISKFELTLANKGMYKYEFL